MSLERTTRPLSLDDLERVREVREPLRRWLQQAHGRRGRRDGALGLASAVTGLLALGAFGVSPLVAMAHILLALAGDGIGARLTLRRTETLAARAFASPLEALAFAEAVRDAAHVPSIDSLAPRIRTDGGTGGAAPDRLTLDGHGRPGSPRARVRLEPVGGALVMLALLVALFAWPLAEAATTTFERRDWIGLALLLALDVAQWRAVWRDAHTPRSDAPWDHDWSSAAPAFGQLMFWRHFRLVPLLCGLMLLLVLGAMVGQLHSGIAAHRDFVATLEANLRPLALLLFALSAALHLPLLSAPRHARRTIARLDAFDIDAAGRRLKLLTRR